MRHFDPNLVLVNANKLKVYHTPEGQKLSEVVPTEAPRGLVDDFKGEEGIIRNLKEEEILQKNNKIGELTRERSLRW